MVILQVFKTLIGFILMIGMIYLAIISSPILEVLVK